jgi:hypothetical protein
MPQSEQKRQRKLAKKHAKDSQRRKKLVLQQQQMSSLVGKMMSAACGKILSAGVSESVQSQGMGYVTILRQGPNGLHALVAFLIDSYCLGVKDVGGYLASPADISDAVKKFGSRDLVAVTPGIARAVVEGAVAYARQFGFEPHPDYRKVACILNDIEPESIEGLYSFGRDGKPCYINGPYDDPNKQKLIINKLEKSVGNGNYDVVVIAGDLTDMMFEDYVDDEDYDEPESIEDWRAGSLEGEVRRFDP